MKLFINQLVRKVRPNLTLIAFCAVVAIVSGVTTAVALLPMQAPPSLQNAPDPTTVPVTSQNSNDAKSVDLEVAVDADRTLSASVLTGVVTRFECTPGQVLGSGSTSVWVNGEGLMNVDIAEFDAHKDQASKIIWLPAPEVTVGSCLASLGAPLGSSGVFTIAGSVKSAGIKVLPPDAIAGPRVLAIESLLIPVNSAGQIEDPENLAKLAQTATFQQASQSGGSSALGGSSKAAGAPIVLKAKYQLATPALVSVVQPSAIATDKAAKTCVTADGSVFPITIVGSELGKSFVRFKEGATPPTEIDYKPHFATGEAKCE